MTRFPLVVLGLLALSCGTTPSTTCMSDQQCSTTTRCCSGKCVDLQTTAAHCGTCATACGAQNGAAKCLAGVCSITCSSGFGDCNAMAKDGCETDLSVSVDHCGSCTNVCMAPHASSLCERSLCLQSACLDGYGDCTAAEGCETDLKVSMANCGACGKKCEVVDGVGLCTQSACTVASCNPGFGDCDLLAATGCETDLKVTATDCGSCGMACNTGYKCKDSKCVAPEILFYGGAIGISAQLATDAVSAFNVDTHTWSSVATTGTDLPGARFAHLAVWDTVANRMLVWGGYGSNQTAGDTALWALDFNASDDAGTTPTWKKLTAVGTPPSNRGMFGWAWDRSNRQLYVFGGTDADNNTVYDQLWQLDVPSLTWRQRTESGGPTARYLLSMVWDSTGQRVLLGEGYDDNFTTVDDFYAFDPAADGGGWSMLGATGAPSARTSASFLGDAQPLCLYGGADDFGSMPGDLHRLDLLDAGSQWTVTTPGNNLEPRANTLGVSIKDRRFLYGGYGLTPNFNLINYSEVWELSEDAGWTLIADGGINFVHPGTAFTTGVARE